MDSKVTLYIAEHNVSGLKYFGKTTRWFTQEELQKHYHGSGLYWKRHLKKHGDDVTMRIFGVFERSEVMKVASKFSQDNNIVESKEWANMIHENGLDGQVSGIYHPMYGKTHTVEAKAKIAEAGRGRSVSDETKLKISEAKLKMTDYAINRTETHRNNLSKSLKNKKAWNKGLIGDERCKLSEETKKKMSDSRKGKTISEETKMKISQANKGRKRTPEQLLKFSEIQKNLPKIKCPHCYKEGNSGNMKRWHFDNCKLKDIKDGV